MLHILKSYTEFFVATITGDKTHEVRRISNNLSVDGSNSPFAVGDLLELREFDPEAQVYGGEACRVLVTMVDPPKPWLNADYVLMSIRLVSSGAWRK